MSHPVPDSTDHDCPPCGGTGRVEVEKTGRKIRCRLCDGSGKAPRFTGPERHALLRLAVGWELGSDVHGTAGELPHPLDCSGCRAVELRALLLPALPEKEPAE